MKEIRAVLWVQTLLSFGLAILVGIAVYPPAHQFLLDGFTAKAYLLFSLPAIFIFTVGLGALVYLLRKTGDL